MNSETAVSVRGLTHTYGERTALNGISFEVPRGEIFGLLGPNGGGKTTLFRILTTLMTPGGGKASVFGVPVIDDNPYGDLYYDGNPMPSLRLLNPEWTIELRTFSKTISPGLRIGWMHAPEPHLAIFEKMKQATDLHTNTFCQRLIHAYCASGALPDHVEGLRIAYRSRLAVMLDSLEKEMPEGISWVEPKGGLFIWLTLPQHMNSEHLLKLAVEAKVAFVPGRPFYPKDGATNTLRLNFSNQPEDRIKDGIARLGKILKNEL